MKTALKKVEGMAMGEYFMPFYWSCRQQRHIQRLSNDGQQTFS